MSETENLIGTIRVERRGIGFIVAASVHSPLEREVSRFMPGLHPTREDAWNAGVAEANRLTALILRRANDNKPA
jgi:hypothetical protein